MNLFTSTRDSGFLAFGLYLLCRGILLLPAHYKNVE